MPQMFAALRRSVSVSVATEQKSIAFSAYYNDLALRGMHARSNERWPIERAITEGYERVIWVFKSVNVLGTDSSGLPYRLRQGGEVLDDHPTYRVLNKRANTLESGEVFRKRLSAQICLSNKGAFVERVKSNRGTLLEVHLLPSERMRIVPTKWRTGFEQPGRHTGDGLRDHYELSLRSGGVRNFELDEVSWFRDPHPTDPYMGMTPLEAAGMSVELDHFARLYNVSFMQNDGRPGGILAVRDTAKGTDVGQEHMDRLERRFGKGPVEAGKLSVIAGELSYIDMATRPRDMQYGQTSANSKMELLGAFGMSEVVLGNAAGRTFDNADAEMYNYWTRTVPAHNRILIDGFDEDSSDDLEGFFDTSSVEVLERAEKAKREEMRTEVAAGLRSIKSYADTAGHGDEIEDNVYTRSLYIPNGKTPLPTQEGDAALLGLDTTEAAPSAGGEVQAPDARPIAAIENSGDAPGADASGTTPQALPAGQRPPVQAPTTTSVNPTSASPGSAPIDLAALGIKSRLKALPAGGGSPKARLAYHVATKARWETDDEGERAQRRLEAELVTALDALATRWVERTAARAQSPKYRKGTRHWQPEFEQDTRVGTKALDASRAADEDTWQDEAESAVSPLVTAAAVAAALGVLIAMGVRPPTGETLREMAARIVREVVGDVVRMIGKSAARQARILASLVNDADQNGETAEAIRDLILSRVRNVKSWAEGVSVVGSTGSVNGARQAAVEAADDLVEDLEVERSWVTRRDDRVRLEHRIHGQRRSMDDPFVTPSGALLRFPGDPLAPIHLTAGCRCRLTYRHRRTGRFVLPRDTILGAVASA